MKHPIFKYNDIIKLCEEVINHFGAKSLCEPDAITKLDNYFTEKFNIWNKSISQTTNYSDEQAVTGLALTVMAFLRVIDNGYILIDGGAESWSSKISENTIDKLNITNFKSPFLAGVVNFENEHVVFSIYDTWLSIHVIDSGGFSTILVDGEKGTVGDASNNWDEKHKKRVYEVLSILLYIANFRSNNKRVNKKSVKAKKSGNTPKHTINIIKLKQFVQGGKTREGTSWQSDKTWTVRGHWRHYEEKVTWIDPYWKGIGKEIAEKIYKL